MYLSNNHLRKSLNFILKNSLRKYSLIPNSRVKTNQQTSESSYVPDFSVTPTTYSYQLPLENEIEDDIRVKDSPVSILFEYTGVETSTSNFKKNNQVFDSYPLLTFKKLSQQYDILKNKRDELTQRGKNVNYKIERPKNIKLLSRDFIDDSLYNPAYGYFNKDVEIFTLNDPFNYNKLDSSDHFLENWTMKYQNYSKENMRTKGMQLWHTPTELFYPYYGQIIARYLVETYKAKKFENNLIIYEIGAGNGTLMCNILDWIKENESEIYSNVEYRIIEISSKLFKKQNSRYNKHKSKISIINKDIFQWNGPIEIKNVFFLAFEVFDNFSHDVIKYNINTNIPYQGYVVIDKNNDFKEFFNPKLDYWCNKYFSLLEKTDYYKKTENRFILNKLLNPKSPIDELSYLNDIKNYFWPFRNKLSGSTEYIPTKLIEFFYVLNKYFPNHNLVSTDFSEFETKDTVSQSYNGPVVQTMFTKTGDSVNTKVYSKSPKSSIISPLSKDQEQTKKQEYQISKNMNDTMVNVSTYMVHQGYFDIMFPTNFELVGQMYLLITGKKIDIKQHGDFLKEWTEEKTLEVTKCKNGENPMLDFYQNVKFMLTKS